VVEGVDLDDPPSLDMKPLSPFFLVGCCLSSGSPPPGDPDEKTRGTGGFDEKLGGGGPSRKAMRSDVAEVPFFVCFLLSFPSLRPRSSSSESD
jgi:hypothetical protein